MRSLNPDATMAGLGEGGARPPVICGSASFLAGGAFVVSF